VSAVAERPKAKAVPRCEAIISQFKVVETDPRAKAVRRLMGEYRIRYGLPPASEADYAAADRWTATVYQGRVIAVFGTRENGTQLVVTDAYAEPTRYGRLAMCGMWKWWQSLVDTGRKSEIDFLILAENEPAWRAVIGETKQKPYALVFRYRKGA